MHLPSRLQHTLYLIQYPPKSPTHTLSSHSYTLVSKKTLLPATRHAQASVLLLPLPHLQHALPRHSTHSDLSQHQHQHHRGMEAASTQAPAAAGQQPPPTPSHHPLRIRTVTAFLNLPRHDPAAWEAELAAAGAFLARARSVLQESLGQRVRGGRGARCVLLRCLASRAAASSPHRPAPTLPKKRNRLRGANSPRGDAAV